MGRFVSWPNSDLRTAASSLQPPVCRFLIHLVHPVNPVSSRLKIRERRAKRAIVGVFQQESGKRARTNRPVRRFPGSPVGRLTRLPVGQLASSPLGQLASSPVDRLTSLPVGQLASRRMGLGPSQFAGWPVCQLASLQPQASSLRSPVSIHEFLSISLFSVAYSGGIGFREPLPPRHQEEGEGLSGWEEILIAR